jgi:AcrR family transcriptional regulator
MSSQSARDGMRAPRLERGRARVAALLAAAARVFAEKGYEAATMTEIAATAGAAIGSLYQFFPTKAALAEALQIERLAALTEVMARVQTGAAGAPAAELAERLFAGLTGFLADHPEFIALADRRDMDKARKQASRTAMQAQFAALLHQAVPPLPAGRVEILAVVILQLMKAAIAVRAAEDPAMAESVTAELRAMLRMYLSNK